MSNILLLVTGGIAAYKAAELCRLFIKNNDNVKTILSHNATQFIGTLTFKAITNQKSYVSNQDHQLAMAHIDLAKWADKIIIAPATANCIAKLAHGIADDLITSTCLASTAPVYIAPAMNQAMWHNQATQHNIKLLAERGVAILGPAEGEQACGDMGPGRMLEPEQLFSLITQPTKQPLTNKGIVITAGPTQEAIDPVRYISNHSSGKMGYALAEAATQLGAKVTLITGPTTIAPPSTVDRLVSVTTAQEMLDAANQHCIKADIFIGCAAVADYRLEEVSAQKIKKTTDSLTLSLIKNPDIVSTVKQNHPELFVVGFAAETDNLLQHAKQKLKAKNLDLIIANQISEHGPFGSDHNDVYVLDKHGNSQHITASKKDIALSIAHRL